MPDPSTESPGMSKPIGVAADHGGFELKEYLVGMLREADYEVIDFGDREPAREDDYPDFVVPLARRLPAERWRAAWPSVEAVWGHRSWRTRCREPGPA